MKEADWDADTHKYSTVTSNQGARTRTHQGPIIKQISIELAGSNQRTVNARQGDILFTPMK